MRSDAGNKDAENTCIFIILHPIGSDNIGTEKNVIFANQKIKEIKIENNKIAEL